MISSLKFSEFSNLESDFFLILKKEYQFSLESANLFILNYNWAKFQREKKTFLDHHHSSSFIHHSFIHPTMGRGGLGRVGLECRTPRVQNALVFLSFYLSFFLSFFYVSFFPSFFLSFTRFLSFFLTYLCSFLSFPFFPSFSFFHYFFLF